MTRIIKKFLLLNKINENTFYTYFREEDEFRLFNELYDILWDIISSEENE